MKHLNDQLDQTQADEFGKASASLLRSGTLSKEIKDRLYAARMKAMSLKKPETLRVQLIPYKVNNSKALPNVF